MVEVPRLDDPRYVEAEYADDTGLSGRIALWRHRIGPQPHDVALDRIRGLAPRTVLEVGCGQGAFAAAMMAAGLEVIAVDQSERMVALTTARGVRAERADVQRTAVRGRRVSPRRRQLHALPRERSIARP